MSIYECHFETKGTISGRNGNKALGSMMTGQAQLGLRDDFLGIHAHLGFGKGWFAISLILRAKPSPEVGPLPCSL